MNTNYRPLSAQDVLSRYWDNKIPVDPISIAKKLGARIFRSESINYTGEFLFHEGKPIIVYKPSGNSKRDRFTIAHELGHLALNHGASHRDTFSSFDTGNFIPEERDANRFAAEVLMPEAAVKFAVLEAGLTTVNELCDYFDVSATAMRIRLQTLGFL